MEWSANKIIAVGTFGLNRKNKKKGWDCRAMYDDYESVSTEVTQAHDMFGQCVCLFDGLCCAGIMIPNAGIAQRMYESERAFACLCRCCYLIRKCNTTTMWSIFNIDVGLTCYLLFYIIFFRLLSEHTAYNFEHFRLCGSCRMHYDMKTVILYGGANVGQWAV